MNELGGIVCYFLCFATASLCAYLLVRSYLESREKILLWTAACFCLLAVNNLLLFVDLVILPTIDLRPLRTVSALAAISTLLYGFVSEDS